MKIEKNFWSNPDSWFSAVILNDIGDQVYARVKNDLALIESLPAATTGYHFKDVVKVNNTGQKQLYRDDDISEYKAQELYCPSDNFTFSFQAIITNTTEFSNYSLKTKCEII